jgi:hypothetical protein
MLLFASALAAQTANLPVSSPPPAEKTSTDSTATAKSVASAEPAFPFDRFKNFSAIMVGSVMYGDTSESHIYRADNLLRMQGTEGRGYFIADLAASDTYGLSATGCLKDKHSYFRAFPFSAAKPGRKIEAAVTGKETLDGHDCQIEEVTVSGADLPLPMRLRLWEAEDLKGFPIKVQVLNGTGKITIQYKNVILGPTDPSLFMIPKQCTGGLPQPEKKATPSGKALQNNPPGATEQ